MDRKDIHMGRILIGLYLPLYLLISLGSISNSISQNYAFGLIGMSLVIRCLAITVIFLSLLRLRPEKLMWLWKTAPFIIAFYDLLSWGYDAFVSVEPNRDLTKLIIASIIGFVLLIPSWFIAILFGWGKSKTFVK